MKRVSVLAIVVALALASDALAQARPSPIGGELAVSAISSDWVSDASVASAADGRFVVVWALAPNGIEPEFSVWARRYSAAGQPLGAAFPVTAPADGIGDEDPSVAMDDLGRFAVVWRRFDGAGHSIWARRYSETGSPLAAEFQVNTTPAEGFALGNATVAFDATRSLLVAWWRRGTAGDGDGVVRAFAPSGVPATGEVLVDRTGEDVLALEVAAGRGASGFVVAWRGFDLHARRYSSAGTPLGTVADANPSNLTLWSGPHVAVDGSGRFVVAFQAEIAGSGIPIVVHRFEANGTPRGGPIQVMPAMGDIGGLGDLASDRAGNFLVVWSAPDAGGCGIEGCDTDEGIFAQAFTASGAAISRGDTADPFFAVNEDRSGIQFRPTVTADAAGRFVVAWDFYTNDTGFGETAIFARRVGSIAPTAPIDFGGNGDTDVAVFRPSQGRWLADFDFQPAPELSLVYGRSGDVPVPKDYDGDGTTDLAVFRPSTRNWFVDLNRNGGTDFQVTYGQSSDVPVPADYDGNGAADLAVWRPASGTWFVDLDRNGGTDIQAVFGQSGSIPVPGDYDGDGRTDFAVFHQGAWRIDTDRNGVSNLTIVYGRAGDVPMPGDYDGDGRTDFALFRPASATWFVDTNRNGGTDLQVVYGRSGDIPVAGDFNGDGTAAFAVYRPASGTWFIDTNRNGGTDVSLVFGQSGDVPLRENGWILDRLGVVP